MRRRLAHILALLVYLAVLALLLMQLEVRRLAKQVEGLERPGGRGSDRLKERLPIHTPNAVPRAAARNQLTKSCIQRVIAFSGSFTSHSSRPIHDRPGTTPLRRACGRGEKRRFLTPLADIEALEESRRSHAVAVDVEASVGSRSRKSRQSQPQGR